MCWASFSSVFFKCKTSFLGGQLGSDNQVEIQTYPANSGVLFEVRCPPLLAKSKETLKSRATLNGNAYLFIICPSYRRRVVLALLKALAVNSCLLNVLDARQFLL